jgi:hypothetical protein
MAQRLTIPENTREVLRNWYDEALIDGTPVFQGSFWGRVFGIFGQHAVTLNGRVHLTPNVDYEVGSGRGAILMGHELFHVEQQRDTGWIRFLIKYSLSWRPSQVRQVYEHPLERPAYARGNEIKLFLEGAAQP